MARGELTRRTHCTLYDSLAESEAIGTNGPLLFSPQQHGARFADRRDATQTAWLNMNQVLSHESSCPFLRGIPTSRISISMRLQQSWRETCDLRGTLQILFSPDSSVRRSCFRVRIRPVAAVSCRVGARGKVRRKPKHAFSDAHGFARRNSGCTA